MTARSGAVTFHDFELRSFWTSARDFLRSASSFFRFSDSFLFSVFQTFDIRVFKNTLGADLATQYHLAHIGGIVIGVIADIFLFEDRQL